MMVLRALPLLLVCGIAACSKPEVSGPDFASEKEAACYGEAQAAISDPNVKLQRNGTGQFVEATFRGVSLISIRPSSTFDACMSGVADLGPEPREITFTEAEQKIWEGLSEDQKASAYEFMLGGGKLADFKG